VHKSTSSSRDQDGAITTGEESAKNQRSPIKGDHQSKALKKNWEKIQSAAIEVNQQTSKSKSMDLIQKGEPNETCPKNQRQEK